MEGAFNNGILGKTNQEMLFPRCSCKNVAYTAVAAGWSSRSPPSRTGMSKKEAAGSTGSEAEGSTGSEAALPGLIVTPISEAVNYTRYE